jgi:hypothetical protein
MRDATSKTCLPTPRIFRLSYLPVPVILFGITYTARVRLPLTAAPFNEQDMWNMRSTTREAKVQTASQGIRHVGEQSVRPFVTHVGVQISAGIHTTSATECAHQEPNPFSRIVDLTEEEEPIIANKHEPASAEPESVYTNAVATKFQTFKKPRKPYCQKRQAASPADYRAYKHIFIEGYHNGDGKEEEGRLHIDLAHHVLTWESYDDYDGGFKLTLDRLDLPRCELSHHRTQSL